MADQEIIDHLHGWEIKRVLVQHSDPHLDSVGRGMDCDRPAI
jgi:hypothetical protein